MSEFSKEKLLVIDTEIPKRGMREVEREELRGA